MNFKDLMTYYANAFSPNAGKPQSARQFQGDSQKPKQENSETGINASPKKNYYGSVRESTLNPGPKQKYTVSEADNPSFANNEFTMPSGATTTLDETLGWALGENNSNLSQENSRDWMYDDDVFRNYYGDEYGDVSEPIRRQWSQDLLGRAKNLKIQKQAWENSADIFSDAAKKYGFTDISNYAKNAAREVYAGDNTGYENWENNVLSDNYLSEDEIRDILGQASGLRTPLENGGGYKTETGFNYDFYDSDDFDSLLDRYGAAYDDYSQAEKAFEEMLTSGLQGYEYTPGQAVTSPYSEYNKTQAGETSNDNFEYDTENRLSYQNAAYDSYNKDKTGFWTQDPIQAKLKAAYIGEDYDDATLSNNFANTNWDTFIQSMTPEEFQEYVNLVGIYDQLYKDHTWMIDDNGQWQQVDVSDPDQFWNWHNFTTGANLSQAMYDNNAELLKAVGGYGSDAYQDFWNWATGYDMGTGTYNGEGALLGNWYIPSSDIESELFSYGDVSDMFNWDNAVNSINDLTDDELAELAAMYYGGVMGYMGAPGLMESTPYEKLSFDGSSVMDTSFNAQLLDEYLKGLGY